nr:hypothetical protein CFP56_38760 [Quercus suber]
MTRASGRDCEDVCCRNIVSQQCCVVSTCWADMSFTRIVPPRYENAICRTLGIKVALINHKGVAGLIWTDRLAESYLHYTMELDGKGEIAQRRRTRLMFT